MCTCGTRRNTQKQKNKYVFRITIGLHYYLNIVFLWVCSRSLSLVKLSVALFLTNVDVPLDGLLCLVCMVKVPTTAPMLSPWKPAWSNNPGSNSPLFISRFCQPVLLSLSASTALYLKGALPPLFPRTGFRSVTERRLSALSWFSWISDLFLQTHTHKLLLPSCATPSVLCLILLICQPFPLYLAPCLLMRSCYCGELVNNAVLSNNTADKWMVASEVGIQQAE